MIENPNLKSIALFGQPARGWIGLPDRLIAAAAGCRLPENHGSSLGLEPEESTAEASSRR